MDRNEKTMDTENELQNFKKAGAIQGDIWSSTVINGYPVSPIWLHPVDKLKEFNVFSGK